MVPYGLVVRILAFHVGGPGSIPGVGTSVEYSNSSIPAVSGISVEYSFSVVTVLGIGAKLYDSTPTLRVPNSDVLLSVLTPAAIGLGIM